MLTRARAGSAALLLALAGHAHAATPKDALVMAWNLDALITFDPAQIGEANGADIINNVCDPLVRYDLKDVSKIVPGTAESWSVSPDGLTITFHLRPDLKFPSGKPATAYDAAWSIQRVLKINYFGSSNYTQWGFTADKIENEVKATDDRTLVVTMDRPYPVNLILSAAFASDLSGILDREAGMAHAKTVDGKSDYGNAFFRTAPICVGPYSVTRWDADDVVILTRNDVYYGPKPNLRRVIIRHVPESGAERLLLQKGDVDVARLLDADDLRAVAKDPDINIEQTPMHGFTYLGFNELDPDLAKPKVREAFRYLIDYQELAKTILQYQGLPRADLVPLGAFGALDAAEGLPFKLDLGRAKQLLTEAGYPNGFSKTMILSANGSAPELAQSIAANAAKVGIKLTLDQMADANLFLRGRTRDFQIQLVGWTAGYPDADSMISRHAVDPDVSPEAKLAGYPSWRMAYYDKWVNDMADKAKMERDPAKRIALYHELQIYLLHNGPMAYIDQIVRSIAVRKDVKGFQMSPFMVAYGTASK